jgi:hypothetical protein
MYFITIGVAPAVASVSGSGNVMRPVSIVATPTAFSSSDSTNTRFESEPAHFPTSIDLGCLNADHDRIALLIRREHIRELIAIQVNHDYRPAFGTRVGEGGHLGLHFTLRAVRCGNRLRGQVVEHHALRRALDRSDRRRDTLRELHTHRFAERRHLKAQLRRQQPGFRAALPRVLCLQPDPQGRAVIGNHTHDIQLAVAVEVRGGNAPQLIS